MESLITILIFLILIAAIGIPHWRRAYRHHLQSEQAREKTVKAGLHEPATLHPRIDLLSCIGCASCVRVCPEGVLGIVSGRAAIVYGTRCIGHALCAEACPVGAITMGFGKPKQGMEIPFYDESYMSNIVGLYIVGELGGIGLIRNAIEQSKRAVEHAAQSRVRNRSQYDVAIVGAGPAGVTAALACQAKGLTHIVLEQDELGGSILHYPRQKLVLTSPVDLPMYGRLRISEINKETLLGIFSSIASRFGLNILTGQRIESIVPEAGSFALRSGNARWTADRVILAMGRRGSPRKLGVRGEDHSKVYYRLIEAESYVDKNILVVGGGDSAVEAAVGLARQKGNTVHMSYRRDAFVRLKERNEQRIHEMMRSGRVKVLFNSEVDHIGNDCVAVRKHDGSIQTLANDFVFIFAGGELPAEFLKKVGVRLRTEEDG
jgi:thioredoxin reductase (NADPH)